MLAEMVWHLPLHGQITALRPLKFKGDIIGTLTDICRTSTAG